MVGFVLSISGLALLGGAASWWMVRRGKGPRPAAPVPSLVADTQDLLPESGTGAGGNSLAAFYAYQMAAGKIDVSR
jgi:hypothetical protein